MTHFCILIRWGQENSTDHRKPTLKVLKKYIRFLAFSLAGSGVLVMFPDIVIGYCSSDNQLILPLLPIYLSLYSFFVRNIYHSYLNYYGLQKEKNAGEKFYTCYSCHFPRAHTGNDYALWQQGMKLVFVFNYAYTFQP